MNNSFQAWRDLQNETKKNIFNDISLKTGLPAFAVEKDWWVVKTLDVIFGTEIADHTVFKGGTSLSKAWGLIDRFSEDIDLALDRKFLGFDKELSKSQVRKLRRSSFQYISERYFPLLKKSFDDYGFADVDIELSEPTASDQDPLILEIHYPSLIETSEYIPSRVLVEIGSRSLKEPFTYKQFSTLVGEYYPDQTFADPKINIPTVNPERTFLEKIFLIHEEFQKSADKIKVDRLSRHLYDIEKIMDTEYAKKALSNTELYQHIVHHRKTITAVRGIDYSKHNPDKLNLLPPENMLGLWEIDYKQMQENMIYGESLSFNKLLEKIQSLNSKINSIDL
ncbi:MAG: nucleotidyl transferase AbiEii/AbiGii toxin family protein [Candidatus Marinimicrobia bacterium]|nr:nucleotidyl transferase AbiEii/AbiGii toxin family protein [Candidatus Neomarinimicrobiota bacterium]